MWARRDWALAGLAVLPLCLLGAGSLPVAAAAGPSWHDERPLPKAAGSGARAAITSAGDVAVAWENVGKGINVAVRPAGGRFGAQQYLSRSGSRWLKGHDVIADAGGELIVVWTDAECCRVPGYTRVWASSRKPGGRFSRAVALSGKFAGFYTGAPAVAAGDDESLTVAWAVNNSGALDGPTAEAVIEVADRLPGGGFGTATPISPPAVKAYEPRIARGPSGETVVLWNSVSCGTSPCRYELFASTRPPGGQFGAPESVAVANGSVTFPGWLAASQVDIASDGTVVAVWREGLSCMYCYGADVKVARRPPGQGFESAQTLGHLGGLGPWLALDAADRALALWGNANTARDAVGLNPRVFGAEAPPDQAFGPGSRLERGGDALGITSASGRALAAWTHDGKVVAAANRRGSYCRQSISRQPARSDGDVAANARGDAVAAWVGAKRPHRVMVAMGPADGRSPAATRLSVRPGAGGAARPQLRFALSEAAEVQISVERRAGHRFQPVRSLVRSLPAGTNRVTYGRTVPALPPGRYRALVGASDCDGRHSRSAMPFAVGG